MEDDNKILIGNDIVEISRINNILLKRKEAFYRKVFTFNEIAYIEKKSDSANTVAGMFSAKESISKVLGTGFGKISWQDVEIVHTEEGKPMVNLHNEAKVVFDYKKIKSIDISITHERQYAISTAIAYSSGDFNFNIDYELFNMLPKREKNSHKGTYGKVAIVSGSRGMLGASYLATMSALKSGSGLVYTVLPESLFEIMSIKLIEPILKSAKDNQKGYFIKESLHDILCHIDESNVLAIGPGMGYDKDRAFIIKEIINKYNNPIVIDADGINCLAMNLEILENHKQPIVITPHPGEFARMINVTVEEIEENRIYYSKLISKKYNIIVVLKGFNTIVAYPNEEIYINKTGNPGMATAGSGDLLTGMIASFIGQKIDIENAVKLGVYLHGLAGDMASEYMGEYGLIATDILNQIPNSIKKIHR